MRLMNLRESRITYVIADATAFTSCTTFDIVSVANRYAIILSSSMSIIGVTIAVQDMLTLLYVADTFISALPSWNVYSSNDDPRDDTLLLSAMYSLL